MPVLPIKTNPARSLKFALIVKLARLGINRTPLFYDGQILWSPLKVKKLHKRIEVKYDN